MANHSGPKPPPEVKEHHFRFEGVTYRYKHDKKGLTFMAINILRNLEPSALVPERRFPVK